MFQLPEIFQYDFMIRAFIAGSLVALVAPVIGTFLIVRRYSFLGDTLAHISLVGVAVGILVAVNPVLAATVIAVVAAIGIEMLRQSRRFFGESLLAIFLSGSLAISAVLFSLAHGFNANLFSFIFGSIATVSTLNLYAIAGMAALIILSIVIFYKEFFLVVFDEELADASGIRSRLFGTILVALSALVIAVAIRIVGALLIGALIVIPAATAIQFRQSFLRTLFIGVILAAVAVFSGLVASYYFDLASGGAIVLVSLILFVLTYLLRPGTD